MKKEYIKPSVVIENFKVNEFIAGACSEEQGKTNQLPDSIKNNMNSASVYSCMLIDNGGNRIFYTNCKTDMSDYDTCYQGIITTYFNS